MKAFWTGVAILAALLLQTGLTRIAPAQAPLFDPFLIVLVYCAIVGGEIHGMLAGAAGGWVQDVFFGGAVVGVSGLSKLLIGFGVGLAGARLLVAGPAQRLFILLGATVLDALVFERLAAVFDLAVNELPFADLFGRATVNAIIGAGVFELLERRLRKQARA